MNAYSTSHKANRPGLWDPYVVARTCVQILMSDLYPRKISVTNPQPGQSLTRYLKPSFGLTVYLEPFDENPLIETWVEEYIDYPCIMKLRNATSSGTKAALQFLLSYLRHRDAFIIGELNSDLLGIYGAQCSSITWVNGKLKNIPELDSCAATVIGRYLNYANQLAVLHELYYFKDLLAKLWGPIFIGFTVKPELEKSFPRERQIKLATKMFHDMIDGVPWSQYKATENMTRTLQENSTFYGIRYNDKLAYEIERLSKLPQHYKSNMCDQAMQLNIIDKYREKYQQNSARKEYKMILINLSDKN